MADKTATVTLTHDGAVLGTVAATLRAPAAGLYSLPADRLTTWNPGLNAVGGIPHRTTIYRTLSPSGADDTAAIQAALDACPANQVVQLTAGTFRISGQGLAIERPNITLRGAGPGNGNPNASGSQKVGGGTGTFLVKTLGTSYPVIIIGPRWSAGPGTVIDLSADAVKGASSVTAAGAAALAPGALVVIDSLTDTGISHWNSQDPENASGWFEEPNRPLGDVMEVLSVAGSTVTFTTPLHIGHKVSRSAHLYTLENAVRSSGIEDLYCYGGEGGDGGGGIHLWSCAYCWVRHVEDTWNSGTAVALDACFRCEIRDSYIHTSSAGLYSGGASYGVGLNWYTSNCLIENNIVMRFDKVDVMRSAGGGNVLGYNYMDDGADSGGQFQEDGLGSSHMTTPHYELLEGNEAFDCDQDDRWGNSIYTTALRNHLTGFNRDFAQYGPWRAIGLTQWHWWHSFVGNVLGAPGQTSRFNNGYESLGGGWANAVWVLAYQNSDNVPDGGRTLSTQLRDGNYDYLTGRVHWHGIGGSGANNGLAPPAAATLPASLYLPARPAFFGAGAWPWVDGSNAANPLPGQLPARVRYDAGTPNAVQ